MKEFTFTEDTIRELNRMMFTLYKFFSETVEGYESNSDSWNSLREIDCRLREYAYYDFHKKDVRICLHLNRDKTLSLLCENLILTKIPPKYPKKYYSARYANLYGSYDNLSSAVIAWQKCVKSYVNNELGVLF